MMDIKVLKNICRLCRTEGVTQITIDGVTILFGDKPRRARASSINEQEHIPMSMDELINAQLDLDG